MSIKRFKVFSALSLILILCNTTSAFSQDLKNTLSNDICECLNKLDPGFNMEGVQGCLSEGLIKSKDNLVDKTLGLDSLQSILTQQMTWAKTIFLEYQSLLIQNCDTYYEFCVNLFETMLNELRASSTQDDINDLSLLLQGNYSSDILSKRGTVYIGLNRLDSAMEDFNEALRLNPNNIQALYFKGWIYELKNEYQKAISVYNQITKKSQDFNVIVGLEITKRRLKEVGK